MSGSSSSGIWCVSSSRCSIDVYFERKLRPLGRGQAVDSADRPQRLDWPASFVNATHWAKIWPVGLGSGRRKANQNSSPCPVGTCRRGFEAGTADGPARAPQAGESERTGVATRPSPRRGAHEPASYRRGFGRPDVVRKTEGLPSSRNGDAVSNDPTGNPRRLRRGGGQADCALAVLETPREILPLVFCPSFSESRQSA